MTRPDPLSACVLACATVALTLVGVGAHALSGIAGLGLALAGWVLSSRPRPWVLPRWAGGILLGLIVVWGALQFVASEGPSVRAFVAFLGWIIVIKCWSPRGPRDLGQVIAVAMFVALGTMLSSSSMLVGLLVALLLPLFVLAAILLQISVARARARALAQRHVAVDHVPFAPVVRTGAVTLALCLAGAAAIFVFVPRTRAFGGLAGLGLAGERISGFRDRVDLGHAGLLSDSQGIALSVQVDGGTIPSVAGPSGELYLRGAVLMDYQGGGAWRMAEASEPVPDVAATDGTAIPFAGRGALRTSCEFIISDPTVRAQRTTIFAPWRPVWVRVLGPDAPLVRLHPATGTGTIEGIAARARYRVACTLDAGGVTAESNRGSIGFDSRIVRDLARRVLEQAGLDADPARRPVEKDGMAARALEKHLQSWRYSRELRSPPRGVDPIDWFLDTARQGHCEYFASALAAMCRSVGIDARLVTGYLTNEFDADRGVYTVRHAHAHAWVEAETAPGVWRTLDATPAEERSRLAGPAHGFLLRLERWFAGIESTWSSNIVGFGPLVQDQVTSGRAQRLGRKISDAVDAMASYLGRRGLLAVGAWMLIVGGGVAVALGAAGLLLRAVIRRLPRRGAPGPRRRDACGRLYARVLRCWKRMGRPKPSWRPALEHARDILDASPEAGEVSCQALEVCYAAFFSGRQPHEDDLARARASVDRLELLAR